MTKQRLAGEKGVALIYLTVTLTVLILFSGLAVDTGRAYVVKAQLTKSVDGAALGAARMLNSGDPRDTAARIFKANFPDGYLGTSSVTDPTSDPDFFDLQTVPATGVNIVTVKASVTLPTTFMRLADFDTMTVSSSGEATRRMVDLSLVLDVSSSLGWRWPWVRDAARTFVDGFSASHDRLSLVRFSNGAGVLYPMPASRGFDKAAIKAAIPNALPGGSTAMVEGLYRGWDEVRSVASGQQSGLRIVVIFTDGASNSVPGNWDGGTAKGLRTWDFPDNGADPDMQTHANPRIEGFYDTETGAQAPAFSQPYPWASPLSFHPSAKWMVPNSSHQHHRSSGIPTSFPLQSGTLTVNGASQSSRRGLKDWNAVQAKYPAHVWNINNAARNLLEIVADAARSDDDGDYPVRIYVIGMGELLTYLLGTMPETPESILLRVANDKTSPDFNADQLEGAYYFAATASDVGPAFEALQSQIVRLTK